MHQLQFVQCAGDERSLGDSWVSCF